jgi:hypothetical protein
MKIFVGPLISHCTMKFNGANPMFGTLVRIKISNFRELA